MNKNIDIFLKIGIVAILIIAAVSNQQYSYYTFVRWSVMAVSIYFVIKAYERKQNGLLILFGVAAILFNPIKPIWLQKETWHLIDWVLVASIILTIFFDKKAQNKKELKK
jgi:hypothetical protein